MELELEETDMMHSLTDDDCFPVARSGHVASVVAGNMLIWGGFGQVDDQPTEKYVPCKVLWVYNLEIQEWTRHEFPGLAMVGRSGSGCFSNGYKMFVWGGFPNHNKEVFCLDISSKTWQIREIEGEAPEHRDKFVSWHYHGRLIIFGGFGPPPVDASRDSWVLDPSSIGWNGTFRGWNNEMFEYDIESNRWRKPQTKGPVPCPRASHAGAIIDDIGYIFGGRFKTERRNDMHCFDLKTYTWSGRLQINGPSPEGRSWHSLTTIGAHQLLLCGGFNTSCTPLDDMWVFDTNNLLWTRLKWDLPTPRLWHTAVSGSHLGEVVLFGGCINNILDYENETVHTNSLLHIAITAKPLLGICLEVIWQNIDRLRPDIERLPPTLKRRALMITSPG